MKGERESVDADGGQIVEHKKTERKPYVNQSKSVLGFTDSDQ